MKIASSTIAMESRHQSMLRTEQRESLRVRQNRQPPPPPSVPASTPAAEGAGDDAAPDDIRVQLLKAMLEWLTGKPVKLFDARQLESPSADVENAAPSERSVAPTVEYEYHASRQEAEQTDFAAVGQVTTEDGREIVFALDSAMARRYSEQIDITLRTGSQRNIDAPRPAGPGQRKDPLVINAGNSAAQLSSERMTFDLDADGKVEEVPLLSGGSAYLALDRNQNGRIDSGAELFGPGTGSGFTELARYDGDGNNWIDENDAVFGQLLIWTPEADGDGKLASLKDRNIGALFLGSLDTSFQLRSTQNEDLGAVRTSGLYLTESGEAGSLQQIDLTV